MNKQLVLSVLNSITLAIPLLMLLPFMTKVRDLSCIETTDKMYMLLGVLAISTYWIIKRIERCEK